jgi:uncharacterized membrane protein YagU involved in acid resistance
MKHQQATSSQKSGLELATQIVIISFLFSQIFVFNLCTVVKKINLPRMNCINVYSFIVSILISGITQRPN